MAGSKSDYFEKALLDFVFGQTAFTPPPIFYIALSTDPNKYQDNATGASMTEVSGGGYLRATSTNDATNWPATVSTPDASVPPKMTNTKSNGAAITFGAATAPWGTVTAFYICDAPTGGNVLYGGDLTLAKAIQQGDTATFAASSISITED